MRYYNEQFRRKQDWQKRKIKEKRQLEKYSLTNAILDLMIDLGERLGAGMSYKEVNRRAFGYPRPQRWRYNRAITYLQNRHFIKPVDVNKNDGDFFELTKKGRVHALLVKISKQVKSKRLWDGKWRLTLWDIPETSHNERNKIRRFLKELGHYKMQKSVLVSPYSLPADAVAYLKETGLIKYLRFLRVDQVDDDAELIQYFKLKTPARTEKRLPTFARSSKSGQ